MCQVTFANTNQYYMNINCQNDDEVWVLSENWTVKNDFGLQSVVDTLLSPTYSLTEILVCKIVNIWMPAHIWEE